MTAGVDGWWSPAMEDAVRVTRERHERALTGRERLVGAPFGLALLIVVVLIAAFVPDTRSLHLGETLTLLACFVLAARVEFETGAGYAVPTQLVFVPMVFLLPSAAVPLVVGLAYAVTRALDSSGRELGLERAVGEFANAWYAVGPVLVIGLAGDSEPALEHWPVYLAALASQFLVDAVVSCLRYAVAFGTRPADLLREIRWAHRLDLLLAPPALLAAVAARDTEYAWLLVIPLVGLVSLFGAERRGLVDSQLELATAYRGTALLLGDVLDDDDEYTGRHSRGVGLLALDVADQLGLDDRSRRDVEFSALLHDVGKVAIPKEIVNKPGPLDAEEWAVMRTHTIEGERMLQRVGGVLENVGSIVRSSHESWDGSGYPDGLAGEAIPLAARIVSCCDGFSAMTTDRPYRKARTDEEALDELQRCAGTQFDPVTVEALVVVVERCAPEAFGRSIRADQALERVAAELQHAIPIGLPTREARTARAHFHALIDQLDEGIVLHAADGSVRACNPSAARLLDVLEGTLLADGTEAVALVDANGRPLPAHELPWLRALATDPAISRARIGVSRPGGAGVRWLSVSSRSLRRPGRPQAYAVVSSLTDVTDFRPTSSPPPGRSPSG